MDFEIYCDESGIEALTQKDAHKYISIGGIWIPTENRKELKEGLQLIKEKHGVFGELKWQKISPKYFELYKEVIDFFFKSTYIRFRVILIDSQKIENDYFNNDDAELGFYKFYYQLLHHWILDNNTYNVFLDLKVNRNKGRLNELKRVLNNSNITSAINQVQGLPSEQSLGIQLADVLTGMVSSKFNGEITSKAKISLIEHFESNCIRRPIAPSPKCEERFNVFRINLQGGW